MPNQALESQQRFNLYGYPVKNDKLPTLPYSLKDLNVTRLPDQDDISFENITNLNHDFSVDRFLEFINSDEDVLYLDSAFHEIYDEGIEEFIEQQHQLQLQLAGQSQIQQKAHLLQQNQPLQPILETSQSPLDETHTTNLSKYKLIKPKQSLNQSNLLSICFEDRSGGEFKNLPRKYQQYKVPFMDMPLSRLRNNPSSVASSQKGDANGNLSEVRSDSNYSNVSGSQAFFLSNTPKSGLFSSTSSRNQSKFLNPSLFLRKNMHVPRIYKEELVKILASRGQVVKIYILTKNGVKIDVGLMQIVEKRKKKTLEISRLYISRIYRKLNYFNFIHFQVFWYLFQTYPQFEKIQIVMNQRCEQFVRFFYQIGAKLLSIEGEKKQNKRLFFIISRPEFSNIMQNLAVKLFKQK